MSTGGATALQQENERHYEFKNLTEAIETASYIEKLLDAERLWIANRSSWLFTSQSFLLVAFVTFLGFDRQNLGPWTIRILTWGLPFVGLITCIFVGLAIWAAHREANGLATVGAEVTEKINGIIKPLQIPLLGGYKGPRNRRWTYWLGEFPHMILPWALALLWVALLWAVRFDSSRHWPM